MATDDRKKHVAAGERWKSMMESGRFWEVEDDR